MTTDSHGSEPRAIRTTLRRMVRHRTSAYPNNRLEQYYRGIKVRIRCMRGFKSDRAARAFAESMGNSAIIFVAAVVTTNPFRHQPWIPLHQSRPHCARHHAKRPSDLVPIKLLGL
jgi:transposase-like protein